MLLLVASHSRYQYLNPNWAGCSSSVLFDSVFVIPWDLSLVRVVEQKDIKRDVHVSLIFIHFDFYREESP